ncbi:MAG: type IV pilus biogenesis/stability protein PilW [Gammaproteobacteria bacterium]|nr:type IV pilus biogenesis/stability protein PilW [Gammaproteobacteria bacterium]
MRSNGIIGLLLLCSLLQACASVPVDPGQTKNEKASAVNVQLGIGYLQQNNLELASEKLTKALRQDPESAPANNAYAILQERLKQYDLAEFHYEKATDLDKNNAQAANNYGAFLCRHGRELESEKYFLRALDNPLYSTPEFAYTNAAICLIKVNELKPAEDYLKKALTEKSDFAPALITMARLYFGEEDFENAKAYLDRYHLVARPSASSLWLDIRTVQLLDIDANIDELGQRLATDFPDSVEYKLWQGMQ